MLVDWDDPVSRHALAEQVPSKVYNALFAAYRAQSVIETVNGHAIRVVNSRFGKLYMVGDTGTAFPTLEAARDYAKGPAK